MKLLLLAVGRRHDADLTVAVEDYSKRLRHYIPTSWQLIPSVKGKQSEAMARQLETDALLAVTNKDDYVVLLDERGEQLRSRELADRMSQVVQRAMPRLVFVIGGPYGVDQRMRQRANLLWSLSALTLPHQLVRLILAEQLYRAFTIMRGEPYHHE